MATKNILNLTQHNAMPAQREAGVVEPEDKGLVRSLLTFNTLPTRADLEERAAQLAETASRHGHTKAMIGGAPFFMAPLEAALRAAGVEPCYAFSERRSLEETQPDGTVVKKTIFEHLGFV
jgi:hypothetical protein